MPTKTSALVLLWFACIGAIVSLPAPAQSTRVPPVAREAVPAVLDLFDQYSIVALSEGPHNNQRGHEFRMALVRDPRFGRLVDDVMVEFGNSRYQSVMDRFTAGEDVPYRELRQVWENTTINGPLWDSPIYYEFFAAIREVNRASGSHIRVLLGDPPIDWESIRSADEISAFYPQRSRHAAKVVQEEVLKKSRRALIVYGEGHLIRTGRLGADTLVETLIRESQARILTISNSYPDLSMFQADRAWPIPSLVMVKDTTAGGVRSAAGTPLEWDFDAVLHLGGPSALSKTEVQKSVCKDSEYLKMRFARFALDASPANPNPGSELMELCGLPVPR
jgi:hypothetical protein